MRALNTKNARYKQTNTQRILTSVLQTMHFVTKFLQVQRFNLKITNIFSKSDHLFII